MVENTDYSSSPFTVPVSSASSVIEFIKPIGKPICSRAERTAGFENSFLEKVESHGDL